MDLLFYIEHSLLRQLLLGQAFSEKVSKFIYLFILIGRCCIVRNLTVCS